jgi:F-type H+-transporting ATPase subunit epsilon
MSGSFPVEVVTPAGGVVLSREARHLRLPGVDGHFGILAGHADLMAALGIGVAELDEPAGATLRFTICGGYAQVDGGRVLVLAEAAELPDRIDVARAEAARDRARRRLEAQDAEQDQDRARVALARALLRLRLAGRAG